MCTYKPCITFICTCLFQIICFVTKMYNNKFNLKFSNFIYHLFFSFFPWKIPFINSKIYMINIYDTNMWNFSPMDQFEIKDLITLSIPVLNNLNISFTNIAFYLTLSVAMPIAIASLSNVEQKLVPTKWSLAGESLYQTVYSILTSQINGKEGQKYFPFLYGLFLFILVNNLISMVPYSFASTSHFILTFFISFTVVIGSTILGLMKYRLKFFSLFVPSGCPLGLLALLVLIEFISYLARNVSLGLRLAANIVAGHLLLNILSSFTYKIMNNGIIFFIISFLPLAFIIAFSGLELAIAFIQAQVFVVLTASYINDALNLH